MAPRRRKQKPKTPVVAAVLIGAALLGLVLFLSGNRSGEKTDRAGTGPATEAAEQEAVAQTRVVMGEIDHPTEINYAELDTHPPLKALMAERKSSLGLNKSLDMVVNSDEKFTVGQTTVSMHKIVEKALVNQGRVVEQELSGSGAATPSRIKAYGIYVVQPGDNIWNIHFRILKEFYTARGIDIEESADEPGTSGVSSGVGKILKFSETMVIIYNMAEEKIARDINLIEPLSKIIVYNMDAIFALLKEININHVDRLQFDGENIWIPAENR